MVVMGIDPGLANLGIGIVREEGKKPIHLHSELVRTSSESPNPQRLALLYLAVKKQLEVHRPEAVAIETQFFHQQHAATAFKVGEAVGVILLACAQLEVPVFEYGPMEVKQTIVGTGRASKDQVIFMVRATLGVRDHINSSHSADALALALTHLASRRIRQTNNLLRPA